MALANKSVHNIVQGSGRTNSAYPTTAEPAPVWSTIPNYLQKQSGFSVSLASYLNDGGLGLTITLVGSVTNWSFAAPTLSCVGVGTGSFIARVTYLGINYDSNSFSVEGIAVVGADTTAPTVPFGASYTLDGGSHPVLTVKASSDPHPAGEAWSGMKDYRLRKNGSLIATINAANTGLNFPLTVDRIGTPAIQGTFVQAGNIITIAAGGANFGVGTADEGICGYGSITGGFFASCKLNTFTSTQGYSLAMLGGRTDLTPGSPHFTFTAFPFAQGVGFGIIYRLAQNGPTTQLAYTLSSVSPRYMGLLRSGNTWTAYTSTDGLAFNAVAAGVDMTLPSTVLLMLVGSANQAGVTANISISDFNVTQNTDVTYTDTATTVAPGQTYNYTWTARDIALNESAQSPTLAVTNSSSSGFQGGVYQYLASGTNVNGGTRDLTKQPYASSSIWNTSIGSGAVYTPAYIRPYPESQDLVYNSAAGYYVLNDYTQSTPLDWCTIGGGGVSSIILMDGTQPLKNVYRSQYDIQGGGDVNLKCVASGGIKYQVPWPDNYWVEANDIDGIAVCMTPDGRTVDQLIYVARCQSQGGLVTVGGYDSPYSEDIGGPGQYGRQGASGLSCFGGRLRIGELTPTFGAPRHVLAINMSTYWMRLVDNPNAEQRAWPCAAYPAYPGQVFNGEYSVYGHNNPQATIKDVRMGALLALPPSYDIDNMGLLTTPGKQFAWTMQNHGGIIVDTGNGTSVSFYGEITPTDTFGAAFQRAWGFAWEGRVFDTVAYHIAHGQAGGNPFLDDINTIFRAMCVVSNNGPSSVGGGGTPRQPPAPL